jgi:thioredoxin reductase
MTSPVEFPLYGKFNKTELPKENLLEFWLKVMKRADFHCRTREKVEHITKGDDGVFTVSTPNGQYRSRYVILALGKTGSPRKLGVKGEDLPKVMYRLIEADHYVHKKILVIGGGDSAVEAAMGLAHQVGNSVTLSYRQSAFSRIKDRNAKRIEDLTRRAKITVLFNSNPIEFRPDSVVLDVNGTQQTLPNDFVWIFVGGEPPTAFLKKIGIGFGERDLTREGAQAAKQAANDKDTLVSA